MELLYACEADRLGLLIYEISECRRAAAEGVRPEPLYSVYVDSSYKTGNVFAFNVRGVKLGGLAYCLMMKEVMRLTHMLSVCSALRAWTVRRYSMVCLNRADMTGVAMYHLIFRMKI